MKAEIDWAIVNCNRCEKQNVGNVSLSLLSYETEPLYGIENLYVLANWNI